VTAPRSTTTRQRLLYASAFLFFAYSQWAIWTWLAQHGSFSAAGAHAWDTLMRDPFVLMAWTDMAIFTAIVLVWLWRDLTRTGFTRLYWWMTLLTGCPALLVYLARRPVGPSASAQRDDAAP
jgi:hypothetical protein